MATRCALWWGAVLLMAGACIVDEDKPCGAGQVKYANDFEGCVCAQGLVPNTDGVGCHACASGEVVVGDRCVAMPADAGSSGMDAGPSSGSRGEGETCTGPSDCASFDATYCQMLQAPFVCLVQGCATGEHRCSGERVCCDFAALPLLAATNGLCVPSGSCPAPGKVVTP